MKVILSPAKKMVRADDDFTYRDLPVFLEDSRKLLQELRSYDEAELKKIWKCSDRLVRENMERLQEADLERNLSPAVFSYVGLAFQHMAPGAMTNEGLDWLQEHMRILSGFYGVLKPFDGITPYRLEMQAVLLETGSLYDFWGGRLYREMNDDLIINLASREYSDAVLPYAEGRVITIVFAEEKNGKLIQKGTYAKMARGEMTYWMAENRIEDPERIKTFRNACHYSEEHSDDNTFVFISERK